MPKKPKAKPPPRLGIQGDRVRLARERAGMTQMALASAVGYHVPSLSQVENGHSGVSDVKLAALSMVLAVSADWLLNLTDDPTPHRRTP